MGKFKYHKLINDFSDMINCYVLGANNQYAGEVITLDINQVVSPMCLGKCGATRIVCHLKENNCINWQCPNFNCRDHLVYVRRKKDLIGTPACRVCGSGLIKSKS